jgi:hypothetical protein
MGNRLRRQMVSGRGGLADTGTNCSIHRFPKGMPSFRARCFNSPARSSSSVRVVRICGIFDASSIDVKTSAYQAIYAIRHRTRAASGCFGRKFQKVRQGRFACGSERRAVEESGTNSFIAALHWRGADWSRRRSSLKIFKRGW